MGSVTNPDDALKFLPTIALFGGLEEKTLNRIISMLQEHRLEPGEAVCRQGEVGRSMFLVRSGEVVVTRETESGRVIRMIRLGEGEFFGEMTLIDIQARSATVVVEQPTTLYALTNRDLYRLYQEDVEGYVLVLQNICRELSRRLRKADLRISEYAADLGDEQTQIGGDPRRRAPP
jgi:CRP/FNR family transcriptional regulator, cyclic AMP receptor protein